MGLKRFSKEVVVNNKVIECVKNDAEFIVSVYDNDRCKYTYNQSFDMETADRKYDELIDKEYEKMSHQC